MSVSSPTESRADSRYVKDMKPLLSRSTPGDLNSPPPRICAGAVRDANDCAESCGGVGGMDQGNVALLKLFIAVGGRSDEPCPGPPGELKS
eukprot:1629055-Pyramimonas_sp.AAC.1